MISFDLRCADNHVFEVWFGSSRDYEDQRAKGQIECPYCGDTASIEKAPMAPNVASKKDAVRESIPVPAEKTPPPESAPAPAAPPAPPQAMPSPQQILQLAMKVQDYVEKNSEDVGKAFPEEARKIHYGESEERAIRGQATEEEREELADEGIEVNQMPWFDPIKH